VSQTYYNANIRLSMLKRKFIPFPTILCAFTVSFSFFFFYEVSFVLHEKMLLIFVPVITNLFIPLYSNIKAYADTQTLRRITCYTRAGKLLDAASSFIELGEYKSSSFMWCCIRGILYIMKICEIGKIFARADARAGCSILNVTFEKLRWRNMV